MISATDTEQRRQPRVAFFLVPVEREQVPVWLFKPPALADGVAGLVVNMSEGGAQVLTPVESPLGAGPYTLHLLIGQTDDEVSAFTGTVRRVWSQPLSNFAWVNGLAFEEPQSGAATFLQQFQPTMERRWVRCLLTD